MSPCRVDYKKFVWPVKTNLQESYNRICYIYFRQMTTAFSGSSRLANFRQKKNSGIEDPLSTQGELKLTLPDQDDKPSYEPTATFNNTRTSMRLLKGKIQRKQSTDHTDIKSAGLTETHSITQKISLHQPKQDLKLVLHDSPQIIEKKVSEEPAIKPPNKRIMIARQTSKDEPIKQAVQPQPQPPQKQQQPKVKKPEAPKEQPKQQKQEYINPHDQKPIIKQEDVEESKGPTENQNDLVECPEGCGRKFNRKALQKHAKACKIVFMSKRKQFNSEAKRLTSKQQAALIKENKKKQKQLGNTKGFDKTNDNWRATSENFRAAIKGIKKEDEGKEEQQGQKQEKQQVLNAVPCEFCEKLFAPVLMEKHLETCAKKKEKEREKQKKKGAAIKKK